MKTLDEAASMFVGQPGEEARIEAVKARYQEVLNDILKNEKVITIAGALCLQLVKRLQYNYELTGIDDPGYVKLATVSALASAIANGVCIGVEMEKMDYDALIRSDETDSTISAT